MHFHRASYINLLHLRLPACLFKQPSSKCKQNLPHGCGVLEKNANNKPKLHFQGVLRCKWNLCGPAPTHREKCSRPERTETCVARNRKEWPTLSNQMSRLRPDHLSAKFNRQKCASMILSYTHIKSVWKSKTPSIDRLFQYEAVQGQIPSCKML